ncbi:LysR family transcriptional regulator [Prauserella marina]|uniref:DNA-binding transcriptional regulator, LysR family n=1 Tax=Prauserella marina TaxID=530584 RepID=A0A222VL19_9PSEU|nr:LysR family transcriptional regulator [Prauserella marina]ASR34522.1 LysR family transcriptional regulator [Prauserella marina]PWV85874.1 LysR family transcriptional regulator [Prauserella marina]SDC43381.1 DNA-binding transcriptional regulator, LysR family [Prauserella marina]
MRQVQLQQIECLLVLAEELHFGRTAERLGYSQSRVSQLIADLERGVGTRLVERTSRRVGLTRFGAQFIDEIRGPYETMTSAFTAASGRARQRALRQVRIGFHGNIYEEITEAFRRFSAEHEVTVAVSEIPLGSPFSAVIEGKLDAVVVELPVHEAALTVGYRFPPQDRLLAVSSAHPLAERGRVTVEDLAAVDILRPEGDAPSYWIAARVPPATPSGAPIRSSTGITTVQEGLAIVAGGERAMLVCTPLARRTIRSDVRYLPVEGLEEPSQLGLIWRTERATPQLRTLAALLDEEFGKAIAAPRTPVTVRAQSG